MTSGDISAGLPTVSAGLPTVSAGLPTVSGDVSAGLPTVSAGLPTVSGDISAGLPTVSVSFSTVSSTPGALPSNPQTLSPTISGSPSGAASALPGDTSGDSPSLKSALALPAALGGGFLCSAMNKSLALRASLKQSCLWWLYKGPPSAFQLINFFSCS